LLLFKYGLQNVAVYKTIFIYLGKVVVLLFKDSLLNEAVFKTVFI